MITSEEVLYPFNKKNLLLLLFLIHVRSMICEEALLEGFRKEISSLLRENLRRIGFKTIGTLANYGKLWQITPG